MKILYAEDSHELVELYKPMLENMGQVSHAFTGRDARKLLQEEEFDLIVCDHYMPAGNGNEVYNACRGSERVKEKNKTATYIVFSSGPDMSEYRNFNQDAGAFVVMKHYGVDLMEEVGSIMESVHQQA